MSVLVTNINDNDPIPDFESYTFSVAEGLGNALVGTAIGVSKISVGHALAWGRGGVCV